MSLSDWYEFKRIISFVCLFIIKSNRCAQPGVWPQGVFDTEACQNSFPALISLPHFLHADKALLDDVEGLQPDVTKHDLHIDIFPVCF